MSNMAQQSLKMQENQEIGMKKVILTGLYCSIFMIILLNSASALLFPFLDLFADQQPLNLGGSTGTQIFEYQRFLSDNVTIQKYSSITYSPSDYDTIKAGSPLQFYVWYHGDIADWNATNVNNTVRYCSLRIDVSKGVSLLNVNQVVQNDSLSHTIFQENFTDNFQNRKFFVDLYPLDSAYIYTDCKFSTPSQRPNRFIMPMDVSIVTPTQECVACQYYGWASDQVASNKARTMGEYTTDNLGRIGAFVIKFYELLVVAFWVLMILLVVLAVGLIFFGMYWLIKYMAKYVR